jgi:drug/metabolite transporter (DMT)-like permease
VSRRQAAEAALLLNTVLWGATFVLVKSALADISPILFLAFRFGLAALALLLLFRGAAFRTPVPAPKLPRRWNPVLAGAFSGTFLFTGFAMQTLGLRLTTPPKSAFLTGLTSVMVPLLAACVYRIKPQISEVGGVLVSVAGLWLMTLEGAIGAIGRGDLLTVLGAVAFAAHIVTLGHFSEQMPFAVLSVTQVGAAAILALALFSLVETPRVDWRPAVVWGILITGLLCTAVAFTIQAWAMQYTTSTRTALIYMFEPVVAWMTSFLWAGEGLSRRAAAGAALILLGILLVELKPLRQLRHPSK